MSINGRAGSRFYPGWKMTHAQHHAYFNLLGRVYAYQGIVIPERKEDCRKMIHQRAFGRPVSAREIDHLKMFDAFKSACLAVIAPDSVNAQLHQSRMPLIRLRHGILENFSADRILGLLRSARFKKQSIADLDDMTEKELTDLRNTLCARTAGEAEVPVKSSVTVDCPF